MKLNKLARSLALVGLCSQLAVAALAQQGDNNNTNASAEKIERVEVTGSSIKRVKDEGALPLEVVTATQMRNMGITSTDALLRQIGANAASAGSTVSSNTVFSTEGDRLGGGGNYANLRGLGATGTLILLDGRRLSNQGLSGGSVDLNAIPFEMIERVEILKDGASAIYGTDAIGGVINFILKKDYQGFSISGTSSVPTINSAGIQRKLSVAGGFGSLDKEGFNIMGSISGDNNAALRGIDRSWATGYNPSAFAVPDTTSSPGYANIIGATGTALSTTGTTIAGGGATQYTVLNGMALSGAGCNSVPFGVGQVPNITIIPGLGYSAANSTYRCGTDYARQYMMQAPQKDLSAVLRGTVALGKDATGFVEYVGSRVSNHGEYTPYQFSTTSGPTSAALTAAGSAAAAAQAAFAKYGGIPNTNGTSLGNYPVSGPYYQNLLAQYGAAQFDPTKPIAYRLRMNDWGYRTVDNVSTNQRLTLGVDGTWNDYDYKASISHGEAGGHTDMLNGFADTNKLIALLASGIYNPFLMPGQSQSPEAQAAIADSQVHGRLQSGKTTVDTGLASISGKAFTLPAGEADFAVGVEARKESYDFSGTQGYNCVSSFSLANLELANSVMGCTGNGSAPNSSRKIGAVYGELILPVTKMLELQLALRYDHYQEIGGTTNPKLAFKFTPMKDLLFRGSASTGFRAPTPQQLHLASVELASSGTSSFADPLKCPNPAADPTNPACQITNLVVNSGGNPNLKPEKSHQASLGVVFSPLDSLTASADYWEIHMKDRIHLLTYTQELQNYDVFASNFIRDDQGNLTSIQAGWINAGSSDTKGIDFTLTHNAKLLGGKLVTTGTATKMISDKEALINGQPMVQYVDQWKTDTLYQKWRTNISSTFSLNDWSTTLSVNYSSGYNDEDRTPYVGTNPAGTPVHRRIASYTTFNLFTTYTGIKNVTLTGGLVNMLDRQPPFTWHDPDYVIGAGYDPRVADPRGRTLQVSARYSF
ncbi:TonB-dependent receptor [Paucibacter sp. R3-3]|uniref:TonB-dependent receptor n=1 Tax=Roseateles agri TaxID=3098619 RepID=A0ABU5DF24_9BURK|nr:TonB-dependent receptor [Paucibacter sp. R3-3]MDY0744851.1 TonB-dependent receptor [Paucibacter sp. R3-3]